MRTRLSRGRGPDGNSDNAVRVFLLPFARVNTESLERPGGVIVGSPDGNGAIPGSSYSWGFHVSGCLRPDTRRFFHTSCPESCGCAARRQPLSLWHEQLIPIRDGSGACIRGAHEARSTEPGTQCLTLCRVEQLLGICQDGVRVREFPYSTQEVFLSRFILVPCLLTCEQ